MPQVLSSTSAVTSTPEQEPFGNKQKKKNSKLFLNSKDMVNYGSYIFKPSS
jgi:hypothetical protein